MNGPDHYAAGERLLERAAEGSSHESVTALSAQAQAHFTAALVAVQVDDLAGQYLHDPEAVSKQPSQ